MEIKINTEHELTPLEQCYLACIYNQLSTELNFNILMENGYLTEFHTLTLKGEELFNPKIDSAYMIFVEVYDKYPHKVSDRVLKAKSINSGDGDHCLKKYKHYLKQDSSVGSKMLKGLLNEISLRKKGNSEQYFQDIKTWFNQKTWEKYFDLEIQDTQERVERI